MISIFGGEAVKALEPAERRGIAARLMPKIRGLISKTSHKVGHFDDSPAVLEFVNSKELRKLAPLGTSCPDHFLRTKIRPLVIEFDPAKQVLWSRPGFLVRRLNQIHYALFFEECTSPNITPVPASPTTRARPSTTTVPT